MGDRGVRGYIKKDDLLGGGMSPRNPAEAIRQQDHRNRHRLPTVIPIYAADGVTEVDQLVLPWQDQAEMRRQAAGDAG